MLESNYIVEGVSLGACYGKTLEIYVVQTWGDVWEGQSTMFHIVSGIIVSIRLR